MIKGFRFTNQLANAEVDARIHQEFLNKNDGIFYGMDLSKTNNSITISEGLCEIAGRPVAVVGNETIQVGNENLYCVLVLEIDLSKDSTKDAFNQVNFKLLTSSSSYSNVTQQDINKFSGTDKVYQLEFARFRSGTSGITEFKDTRKFLNIDSIYKQIEDKIKNIEDGSIYILKTDEVVLYENENGAQGTIKLSEDINNFSFIAIVDNYKKVHLYDAANGTVDIETFKMANSVTFRHFCACLDISDNTITLREQHFYDQNAHQEEFDGISIKKVVGYRRR